MNYKKNVELGKTSKDKLLNGVNTLANAVVSTFGASGRTMILQDMYGRPSLTKDGVSVARTIELEDEIEDMGCSIIKESAEKTVGNCGDGTTATILLAQYLANEGTALIDRGLKPFEVKRGIEEGAEKVIELLTANSIKVTDKTLKDVASISANNDSELGEIIANAFIDVGSNGVVTVEESKTGETHTTSVKGLEIERGYDNRYFITDENKEIAVLDSPLILLVDSKIKTPAEIHHFLEYSISNNRPLLIVGEMEEDVLGMLLLNKVKGGVAVCSIKPPAFGLKRKDLMIDLAVATGATLIDDKIGDNFENFDFSFLGEADKIIVNKGSTTIMTAEKSVDDISNHISLLKKVKTEQESKDDKEFIDKRIATLAGKVSVINVGGRTDVELKERLDRVDDAVNATKSSLEKGVSPGGGIALYDISFNELVKIRKNESFNSGVILLKRALIQPLTKIIENAGLDIVEIKNHILNDGADGYGYDVKNDKYGNMMDMGIIDPTKVIIHSLRNAVSVAMAILTTNGTVTNIK